MIDDFEKEKECIYKGEVYSVRDNGAVMRHSRVGSKIRPTDNVWTFGKYNTKTGYAEIAGERVHRIVATAFYGAAPSPQYVVDHIDTNRRNNRPENLRWITKLENILLNPITAKKIIFLCGSIEEFLRNPSALRQNELEKDFEWMRAVSKEEAAISLERMLSWAKSDKHSFGGSLGEWIYRRGSQKTIEKSLIASTAIQSESENIVLKETATTQIVAQKSQKIRNSKKSLFNFHRPNDLNSSDEGKLYRTNGELFGLIKSQFEFEKKVALPSIVLPTAGKGIVIRDSWVEEFQESEYCYEGKSRIPKSIILHCKDSSCVAIVIRFKSSTDGKERDRLKKEGFNIVEIDLSWVEDGVTKSEIEYILKKDITKKKWIYHAQIPKAKEMLLKVCEPICGAGRGVLHSYVACPLCADSVQDIECWYCDYRIDSEIDIDGEMCDCDFCFGKSQIQTFEELSSIINIEKEDQMIVGITYNKNGKIETKKFDKEVQLPGKTIFQLWDAKTNNSVLAHNIYSNWYVLIEEDPYVSFSKTGEVFGKLGRRVEELQNCAIRSIFSFDSSCWELIY